LFVFQQSELFNDFIGCPLSFHLLSPDGRKSFRRKCDSFQRDFNCSLGMRKVAPGDTDVKQTPNRLQRIVHPPTDHRASAAFAVDHRVFTSALYYSLTSSRIITPANAMSRIPHFSLFLPMSQTVIYSWRKSSHVSVSRANGENRRKRPSGAL
jgi:hypothetical protein